jgi:hypothetical protein
MILASLRILAPIALVTLLVACGEPGKSDGDGDGYLAPEDCDDSNAAVYPGRGERCDELDNDCDNIIDEGYDEDGDGYKSCGEATDCDDYNNLSFPGAPEICDGSDNDCDAEIDEGNFTDVDQDGYCSEFDCDDLNADTWPGAAEQCDGIDNDCDGSLDPPSWDQDGDAWTSCPGGGDCDDHDATINPEAIEECDGVDEDCDGFIDNGFDADGDTWTVCASPPDCNDQDPFVYPTGPEQCDGLDNDCDGSIDEDTNADADLDGVTACGGDCNDLHPYAYPGAAEFLDGFDNDCDGLIDERLTGAVDSALVEPVTSGNDGSGRLGDAISAGGDFNGDGLSDFAVGVPLFQGTAGRVHLFLGTSYSASAPPAEVGSYATITGDDGGDYLGYSVSLADVGGPTGQGGAAYDDLIIGAPQNGVAFPSTPKGRTYIFFGGPFASSGDWSAASADVIIEGALSTEHCGMAVAGLGDVDGDGLGDLAFTCPWFDSGAGTLRGRTALFLGRASWSVSYTAAQADASWMGDADEQYSGQRLVGNFDFNGDGLSDFAVGNPHWSNDTGRVAVKLGAPSGWTTDQLLADMDILYLGATGSAETLGEGLAVGDANDDGFDDLVVGGPCTTGCPGTLGLLFGAAQPSSGAFSDVAALRVDGAPSTNEAIGQAMALMDLDSDGWVDLLFGGPGHDGAAGGDQGRLSVLYGPLESLVGPLAAGALIPDQVLGEAEGDAFAKAMAVQPDYNGDGGPDLVLSAPFNDASSPNAGRLYFLSSFQPLEAVR